MVNDRSAPLLDSKSQTPKSQTPPTEHPYIRLYQYLQQQQSQPKQQAAPSEEQKKTAGEKSSALSLESKTTIFSDTRGWLQEAEFKQPPGFLSTKGDVRRTGFNFMPLGQISWSETFYSLTLEGNTQIEYQTRPVNL